MSSRRFCDCCCFNFGCFKMQRESGNFEDGLSLSSEEDPQRWINAPIVNNPSNQQQYDRMILFMKDHKDTTSMNKGVWFELAVELNKLGPPKLSTAEWRALWLDYKYNKSNNGSLAPVMPTPVNGNDKPITSPPTSKAPPAAKIEVPSSATPPVSTPPVATPPVATPPVATPPVATPPVATPPVVTPPVATLPVATPPVATPPVVTPPVVTPPVATPPVVTPPVATPPVATPPVATPPVATPPVATLPVVTPPAKIEVPKSTAPPVAKIEVPNSSSPRPPNAEKKFGDFETEILRRLDNLELIMKQQLKTHEELLLNVKLLTTKCVSAK